MISFQLMKPEDITVGLSLCRSAGWNQLSADWGLFLKLSPQGCLVALDENKKVIGTVTTIRYQNHFSWIGMVLVDPAKRKQGIGMQLLIEALKILKDEKTVKLDATPAGREVYLKLNFVDEYKISRMHASSVSTDKLHPTEATILQAKDFERLLQMDYKVFDGDREHVLQWLWKHAPQFAFIVEEHGLIKGYCFGRPGHNFHHIGPIIAEDVDTASRLVSSAIRKSVRSAIIIDILHHTQEWKYWLTTLGFAEQRQLTRMYLGSNDFPGLPEKQFAILGPEFG